MVVFVFIVVFCGFLPGQIELAAYDEEDFSLGVPAHGVEGVVVAGLALKDGQVGFKSGFEALQDGFSVGCAEYGEQAPPVAAGL